MFLGHQWKTRKVFLAGGRVTLTPILQGWQAAGLGQGGPLLSGNWSSHPISSRFNPHLAERIRLDVAPEVKPPWAYIGRPHEFRGLYHSGFDHGRVQTEIELESGQSLRHRRTTDRRMLETKRRFHFFPASLAGKLVSIQIREQAEHELLVIVTPEIVRPIPAGQACAFETTRANWTRGPCRGLPVCRPPANQGTDPSGKAARESKAYKMT
jgi:pilus assembly protein CpaC